MCEAGLFVRMVFFTAAPWEPALLKELRGAAACYSSPPAGVELVVEVRDPEFGLKVRRRRGRRRRRRTAAPPRLTPAA